MRWKKRFVSVCARHQKDTTEAVSGTKTADKKVSVLKTEMINEYYNLAKYLGQRY